METTVQSELAESVRAYLEGHQRQMLAVLEALVRAESPTDVPEAQADAHDILSRILRTLGFEVGTVRGGPDGRSHLYARPRDRRCGAPTQLLVGHSDTVWDAGTLEEMPFVVDGNEVRGPGVFDMKGGLVQMLFALAALRSAGVSCAVTPVVFINSDEEQGSPTSRRHIRRLARAANRAFVLEPALGLDGKIKTSRKGAGRFVVHIQGKSAHAGLDPESGSSAILELSHVVQHLHELNDSEAGVTVNVGTIDGGTHPNVVADEGRAEVDVRVRTSEQAEEIEAAIRGLSARTAGTSLAIEGGFGRLPMEPTPAGRRLWERAQTAGQTLGLALEEARSGGVSDGNTTSQFTPTLDGLGPVGDGAHAAHEFCYLDKMVERSALVALLLAQPPLGTRAENSSSSDGERVFSGSRSDA